MAETSKAHPRRMQEQWYQRFVRLPVLDIGSGVDPLPLLGTVHWDYQWTYVESESQLTCVNSPGPRDAQTLAGIPDGSFATVYASHILEHLPDPRAALRNWWRVLQPGGNLIVAVPHRDLYEKRRTHPSRWNPHDREGGGGHLSFWLPDRYEDPHTLSLVGECANALGNVDVMDFRVIDAGYDYTLPEDVHPVGEYAIEIILRKPHDQSTSGRLSPDEGGAAAHAGGLP